jgi:hypothetical protein
VKIVNDLFIESAQKSLVRKGFPLSDEQAKALKEYFEVHQERDKYVESLELQVRVNIKSREAEKQNLSKPKKSDSFGLVRLRDSYAKILYVIDDKKHPETPLHPLLQTWLIDAACGIEAYLIDNN